MKKLTLLLCLLIFNLGLASSKTKTSQTATKSTTLSKSEIAELVGGITAFFIILGILAKGKDIANYFSKPEGCPKCRSPFETTIDDYKRSKDPVNLIVSGFWDESGKFIPTERIPLSTVEREKIVKAFNQFEGLIKDRVPVEVLNDLAKSIIDLNFSPTPNISENLETFDKILESVIKIGTAQDIANKDLAAIKKDVIVRLINVQTSRAGNYLFSGRMVGNLQYKYDITDAQLKAGESLAEPIIPGQIPEVPEPVLSNLPGGVDQPGGNLEVARDAGDVTGQARPYNPLSDPVTKLEPLPDIAPPGGTVVKYEPVITEHPYIP